MPTRIREVPLHRTTDLRLYRDLDSLDEMVDEISHLGRRVAKRLGKGRLWMLNSTERGGGVAEMLPRVCSLLADLGIHTRWIVLEPGEPRFFTLTKQLHNMLHGERGEIGDRALYERVSREAAASLHDLREEDVLVVHDPQPAGIAVQLQAEGRPRLLWRCHVGVSERNEQTRAAWDFLEPYLAPYGLLLFSSLSYAPRELLAKSAEQGPGIDPLSHKNRALRPYKLVGVLRSAQLIDGPPSPDWARFTAPALRYVEGAWELAPIPNLLFDPFVLRISRFDRLKGFQFLIPAFASLVAGCSEKVLRVRARAARVGEELERVQLVLAGPDPAFVADDPEAAEVLEELCAQHRGLPEAVRRRVHLLRLPMVNPKENALIVNALQRSATVAVQNSIREGFGLTVAEALWKGTPVIASNRGGLALQIRHGTDGLLVDPRDEISIGDAMLRMIANPLEAEAMGRSGRKRVREHFLVLEQVRSWLQEIEQVIMS